VLAVALLRAPLARGRDRPRWRALSLLATRIHPPGQRRTAYPMIEVAVLFFGIFLT